MTGLNIDFYCLIQCISNQILSNVSFQCSTILHLCLWVVQLPQHVCGRGTIMAKVRGTEDKTGLHFTWTPESNTLITDKLFSYQQQCMIRDTDCNWLFISQVSVSLQILLIEQCSTLLYTQIDKTSGLLQLVLCCFTLSNCTELSHSHSVSALPTALAVSND